MADARSVGTVAGVLTVFVFLSSWLGLSGHMILAAHIPDSFAFMGSIWGSSVAADAVFVATSSAAAIMAFYAARRNLLAGFLLAAVLSWLAYGISYLTLNYAGARGGSNDVLEAFTFVATWGAFGLAFCALAPPLAARWWDRKLVRELRARRAVSEP